MCMLTIVDNVWGDSAILISPPLSKLNAIDFCDLIGQVDFIDHLQQPNQIAEIYCNVV